MIPDKLVTAAAEAMENLDWDSYSVGWETLARAALAAAFAVLPECDEAFDAVASAFGDDGIAYPAVILEALAKEFGAP